VAKKLFIKTYGCQMNVYDSERMAALLSHHGYTPSDGPEDADLVLLNTCHIREKAAEKVYSELGRLARLREDKRRRGEEMLIGVAGCVAQAEGEAMLERAPYLDIVVGPQAYHRLPEMLARRARAEGGVLDTDFPVESKFDELPAVPGSGAASAFLTIQEGCDKFCTFCVVPYTRGAEDSRPAERVLGEARHLVDQGAREITLLGQNVNAYHGRGPDGRDGAYHGRGPDGRDWNLARLIRRLARIEGLERIRYTTSHPRDMDDELIAAHGEVAELMPYLHLPVQSGSDAVLKAMNRRYSADDYRDIVRRLRRVRPDIALSSDFIVGFPGETEGDFEATLDLVREVGFASAFSFAFSPRPGTPGAALPRQVPAEVKSERLARLQSLLAEQNRAFNEATVGAALPVLIERPGRHPGQMVGRTPYNQAMHVTGPSLASGMLVAAVVTECHAHSLGGRLVPAGASKEEVSA